jgi:hypothetical protein
MITLNRMSKSIAIPDEVVISKIYLIRGQKVMIDRDLAEPYGVETFDQWRDENIISSAFLLSFAK